MLQKGNNTYNVFMLRMALRDIIASVTAFLNCLKKKKDKHNNNMPKHISEKDIVKRETI